MYEQQSFFSSDAFTFFVFVYVVWSLIAAFAVATAASKRGRTSVSWFFLSLILNPVLTTLLLLAYPVEEKSEGSNSGSTTLSLS